MQIPRLYVVRLRRMFFYFGTFFCNIGKFRVKGIRIRDLGEVPKEPSESYRRPKRSLSGTGLGSQEKYYLHVKKIPIRRCSRGRLLPPIRRMFRIRLSYYFVV